MGEKSNFALRYTSVRENIDSTPTKKLINTNSKELGTKKTVSIMVMSRINNASH